MELYGQAEKAECYLNKGIMGGAFSLPVPTTRQRTELLHCSFLSHLNRFYFIYILKKFLLLGHTAWHVELLVPQPRDQTCAP